MVKFHGVIESIASIVVHQSTFAKENNDHGYIALHLCCFFVSDIITILLSHFLHDFFKNPKKFFFFGLKL